jgi:SLA1 homology domain 1, SHD1
MFSVCRHKYWFVVSSLPLLLTAKNACAQKWTDITGKFSVDAEFVAIQPATVMLKKQDGSSIAIPLEKLSSDDRKRAMEFAKQNDGVAKLTNDVSKWTDATGKFSIEAEVIALHPAKVTLNRRDYGIVTIPFERLSIEDQQRAKALGATQHLPQQSASLISAAPKSSVPPETMLREEIAPEADGIKQAVSRRQTPTTATDDAAARLDYVRKLAPDVTAGITTAAFLRKTPHPTLVTDNRVEKFKEYVWGGRLDPKHAVFQDDRMVCYRYKVVCVDRAQADADVKRHIDNLGESTVESTIFPKPYDAAESKRNGTAPDDFINNELDGSLAEYWCQIPELGMRVHFGIKVYPAKDGTPMCYFFQEVTNVAALKRAVERQMPNN